MRWITELADKHKGETCFLVGNGMSKKCHDIDTCRKYGKIIACNFAFRDHHVDYLFFRDAQTIIPGFHEFKGTKFTIFPDCLRDDLERQEKEKGNLAPDELQALAMNYLGRADSHAAEHLKKQPMAALWSIAKALNMRGYLLYSQQEYLAPEIIREAVAQSIGDIYLWHLKKPEEGDIPVGRMVKRGSTGYCAMQCAYIMGFKRIVLVGCDCCRLHSKLSSNTHYDDTPAGERGIHGTMQRYSKQFEDAAMAFFEKGVMVYKLGFCGAVEVPFVTMDEIKSW